MLNIGDSVGCIYKYTVGLSGDTKYGLRESKINKIVETRSGKKYHLQKNFYPLDCDEVDSNTELFEKAHNCIMLNTIIELNDITRYRAERWVAWANDNPDEVKNIFDV